MELEKNKQQQKKNLINAITTINKTIEKKNK